MQPPQSSAPTRILLLIESANLPTPEHLQPRARVLRTDQLRPDQLREVAPERVSEHTHEHASEHTATSSTREAILDGANSNGTNSNGIDSNAAENDALSDGAASADATSSGAALPPPEDVAPGGCGDSIEALRAALHHGHYEVQVLGSDLLPDALHQSLREENRPEVVILEASRDVSVVAARCYEVRHEAHCSESSLLLVLPLAVLNSPNAPQTVSYLLAAGADDFLACNAPHYELTARVASLAKLARTRHELAQTHEKLRNLLQTDELTHLLSRRFFFRTAHREYERAHRYGHDLSCLMVDVNYFRRITETMGFACGDAVLCHVANVLRDVARDVDIVARFSDQKFVLLLPESDMSMAEKIAERIGHEVAAQPFMWQDTVLPLSVSIGESTWRAQNPTPDQTPETASPNNEYSNIDGVEVGHATTPETNLDEISATAPELHRKSSPSLHEAIASMLEEADAALYVAKRGVRNNLMETPMTSPLLQSP